MAVKYLTDFDLAGNELQNFVVQNLATAPTGREGQIYYDTGLSQVKVYDGSEWIDLGKSYSADGTTLVLSGTEFGVKAGGITSTELAADSVTASKLSGVGNGTNGQILKSDGDGTFSWISPTDEDVNKTNLAERLTQLSDPIIGDGTGTVVVNGNFIVSGETTTVDTVTLTVSDNIIVLNTDVTEEPTEDAGVEIERGTSPNTQLKWNETNDRWQFTNDGTTFYNIPVPSEYAPGDITGVTAGDGVRGGGTTGTVTITNDYHRVFVILTGEGAYARLTDEFAQFMPESIEVTVKEVSEGGYQFVITDWYVDINTGDIKVFLPAGIDYVVSVGGIRA